MSFPLLFQPLLLSPPHHSCPCLLSSVCRQWRKWLSKSCLSVVSNWESYWQYLQVLMSYLFSKKSLLIELTWTLFFAQEEWWAAVVKDAFLPCDPSEYNQLVFWPTPLWSSNQSVLVTATIKVPFYSVIDVHWYYRKCFSEQLKRHIKYELEAYAWMSVFTF